MAGYKVDPTRKYTYQDYLELAEKPGYRYEVLDGVLVKDPSPNVMHQRVSRRLQRVLEDYFWETDSEGELFNAPLDVTLHDFTVVRPDLFYVPGRKKKIIKETRIDGSPALVVEVLSPSNKRKDRLQKMHIYLKAGVEHYWLVSPEEKTLECFALRDGNYALVAAGMDEEVVDHPDFMGLSIPLKSLWEQV
ncbi:MAG: Uma2 family endonuclease [Dethiobacteria bacterium]|jgi:Uma2 family endonuclease